MTTQELLNASGRLIGELRADRSFGTNESAQLLVSLNNYLAVSSVEGWAIHNFVKEIYSATGAASYTYGPTGTWAPIVRPIRIEGAATLSAAGVRVPVQKILTAVEWNALVDDDSATSDYAKWLWPDYGAYPYMTVRLFPKVNTGSSVELYTRRALTALASLATTVDFPPGYEQALVYGFAVKIAPEFGRMASDDVKAIAQSSKDSIAALNAQILPAPVEAA